MSSITLSGDYTDFSDDGGPLGITIKAFSHLATLSGLGKLELEARELIDVDNRSIQYFIIATVTTPGDYPREGRSIIKYEEIDKTCAAIDRLKLANASITKFGGFEVEYSTSDKFRLVVYSQARGGLGVSVSADGNGMFVNDVRKLDGIKLALKNGKKFIDDNKNPAA